MRAELIAVITEMIAEGKYIVKDNKLMASETLKQQRFAGSPTDVIFHEDPRIVAFQAGDAARCEARRIAEAAEAAEAEVSGTNAPFPGEHLTSQVNILYLSQVNI